MSEHPDAQLPLDLQFLDGDGKIVRLGEFFKPDRPVILQLGYYGCPMLCDVISRSLVDTAKTMGLNAGKDFTFVFVSISPAETEVLAHAKQENMIAEYAHPDSADGFHCLVGQEMNIKKLAAVIGYKYKAVGTPGPMGGVQQYSHPAVLMVVTPDGKISRYLYGIAVPQDTLRLSLVEASAGKIGTSWDRLALLICCWDPGTGKYTVTAENIMRLAGVGTMLIMGVSALWLFRHGRPLGRNH